MSQDSQLGGRRQIRKGLGARLASPMSVRGARPRTPLGGERTTGLQNALSNVKNPTARAAIQRNMTRQAGLGGMRSPLGGRQTSPKQPPIGQTPTSPMQLSGGRAAKGIPSGGNPLTGIPSRSKLTGLQNALGKVKNPIARAALTRNLARKGAKQARKVSRVKRVPLGGRRRGPIRTGPRQSGGSSR